ncbi:MAG: S-layer homology domain-containing protein [Clostridiaceae bacterium]|jgi:hypothetical protein|nr:S-layer homology domain-containing protein [Clostridiaceae bacterium]
MKKSVRIIVVLFIFAAALTFCGFAEAEDVPYKGASTWAVPELDKAAGYGFITDRIKNNMKAAISREEFAEIAVKLYEKYTGKPAAYSDMSAFTDTNNPEIFKAYSLKIVNGTDLQRRLFSPDQFTNREQVAAMLFRTVQAIRPDSDFSAGEAEKFVDENEISDWALEPVRYMIANGFLKGAEGKIGPKDICTREMAVLIATRVYEKYSSGSGEDAAGGNGSYNWDQIVINDTVIFRDNYHIKNKEGFYYIFIDADRFKYAFKLPYAGSYTYPEVDIIGGSITASWSSGEDTVLKVEMQEGNTEAVIGGTKIDAGMAPYTEGGKMHIPINLFISAMDMDVKTSSNDDTLYVQYKDAFPRDILVGTWSDTNIDLFAVLKNIPAGSSVLPTYATAYKFNSDGTYELRKVSAGGFNDTIIMQRGKYEVMGNTIMYHDIYETIYKGYPFSLKYEDMLVDRPYYEFIYNYDPKDGTIEIGGFWLSRK